MKTIGLLLANGRSERFGNGNKLLANLHERPLISYAADAMRNSNIDQSLVVTHSHPVSLYLDDFELVSPTNDEGGLGDSINLGVTAAIRHHADRVLIQLADMPLISGITISKVIAACHKDQPSAVANGKHIMPPACFPSRYFDRLMTLQGQCGAAKLLKSIPDSNRVRVPKRMLFDIDTPEDLLMSHDML